MARAMEIGSAFVGLRRVQLQMLEHVERFARAAARGHLDADEIDGLIEEACSLALLLRAVAQVEDEVVFPRLRRWLGARAGDIDRATGARDLLWSAVFTFIRQARKVLTQGSTDALRLSSVTERFRTWQLLDHAGVFERCDRQLGRVSKEFLSGMVELSLAAPTAHRAITLP